MTWIPWLLLLALGAAAGWAFASLAAHLRWARRSLRGDAGARRPDGWLVRALRLGELFAAIESRAADEEERRAAAARRVEALLEPLTDAVLVVDAQDRLRLANPAAAALFGLAKGDVGGPVVPLARSADFIELVRRVRAEGDARATILLNRAPLADVWVQAAGARTDPEAFGAGAAIFVLADVTALKRLQAMERDFVTNVSHDLRTPVTILRGYAETLAEDQSTMSAEDRARFAQKIVGSVGRLQGLVEGLLSLASLETSQDLRPETGALHAASRAAGVRLELDLASRMGGIADPLQSRRLVQNLIDTALAHATGLTRLVIATRDTPKGTELSVEDDGAGVAPADLPRLFDRFYRTDKSRRAGGSGLGLSIVRQVAELHGGSATAEPAKPKGLRITVTLPNPSA
ncbi:MAG: sensor histidine kinase [Verrucomicrobiota bacterium]